jgi:hypothetical protein
MNKQQTAVQWLIGQISEKQPNGMYVIDTLDDVKNVFEQALQMEKEQIENSYWDGGQDVPANVCRCEEYYNETYGGNK